MRITVQQLSVRYGQHLALDRIDLSAKPGRILGLIGANGSGKSSLVKAIAGIVPAQGEVLFDGRPTRPARIGYMPQDISGRAALTVFEVVLLGRLDRLSLRISAADKRVVCEILADFGIAHLAGRYLAELSGGQRQMVFLAQALACDPMILLLDEPISALDIRHQLEVLGLIQKMTHARNLTTICVLHDLNATVRHADDIAALRAGKLLAIGSAGDVMTIRTIADAFDVEASISLGNDGLPMIMPRRPLSQKAG